MTEIILNKNYPKIIKKYLQGIIINYKLINKQ